MPTARQESGDKGEKLVKKLCSCPKCKREGTFRLLPTNFKCADIICDFCGYLAQIKSKKVRNIEKIPSTILGAKWQPQKDRMDAGIYFPLYLVLMKDREYAIYYLSADLQEPEMFIKRKPLSDSAKRAGWVGFKYDMTTVPEGAIVRLV